MPARGALRPGRGSSRRRRAWRFALGVVGGATALALVWALGRLWSDFQLAQHIERGLVLAAYASPEQDARLRAWVGTLSNDRRDRTIRRLLARYPLTDPRVRALLAALTGCDFDSRRDDWNAWLAEQRPSTVEAIAARNKVRLDPLWSAPVGFTSWYTTIIPIDGTIFVASLGENIGQRGDQSEGVVRVDGASGAAELIFQPPDTGLRELVGISAADDSLFVACQNGYCYCIATDGQLLWKSRLGAPAASPPLATDVNRDGLLDAVLLTRANTVVALSGSQGRTLWGTPLGDGAPPETVHRPALALLPAAADAAPDILASTPHGTLARLDRRTGRPRGPVRSLNAELRAAVVGCDPQRFDGPAFVAATRSGGAWMFRAEQNTIEPTLGLNLALGSTVNLFASPRTLTSRQNRLLLACIGSSTFEAGNSVCAFNETGLVWRLPAPGNVWGSPAIADLDGDRRSDIVLASTLRLPDGSRCGLLTILNDQGRTLARYRNDVGIECSPVVADVTGDQRLELLICDDNGMMHCFTTGAVGPVEWGSLGGDPHNTFNSENAYSYGQAPIRFQWHWRCR